MRKNSLSKDIIRLSNMVTEIKNKHHITFSLKKLDDYIRDWYIDAIIDEEIEITNKGLR